MGDRLRAGIPPRYVTKPTRSTQPCIPMGSLNRVPALIGWGNGGNVTSAGWQVTLCDPIWHVSSRSGAVLVAQTAIRFLTLLQRDCAKRLSIDILELRIIAFEKMQSINDLEVYTPKVIAIGAFR